MKISLVIFFLVSALSMAKRAGPEDEGVIIPKLAKREDVIPQTFNLSSRKPADFSILGKELKEEPLNTTATDPYEFVIQTENDWIGLSEAEIVFNMKLVKADGTNTTDGLRAAPLNNIARNLFRWIKVQYNRREIGEKVDGLGAHCAYITNTLATDSTDAKTFLPLEGWYPDVGTVAADYDLTTLEGNNTGFAKRQSLFNLSRVQHLSLPFKRILALNVTKPIPPKTKITIKLYPAKPKDVLIGDSTNSAEARGLKIILSDLKVNYHTWILENDMKMKMDLAVTSGDKFVVNEMDDYEMISKALTNGLRKHTLNKIFTGRLPKCIFMVLIENNRLSGALNSNPYVYKRHDLKKYEVSGSAGYQEVDLEDEKIVLGYKQFIRGHQYLGEGTEITYDQWLATHCIHIIDTTPHGNYDDPVLAPSISGEINFVLKFPADATPNNLTILFFGVHDATLLLDGLKSAFYIKKIPKKTTCPSTRIKLPIMHAETVTCAPTS